MTERFPPSRQGQTHYVGCWEHPDHHCCAIAEITRLRALLRTPPEEASEEAQADYAPSSTDLFCDTKTRRCLVAEGCDNAEAKEKTMQETIRFISDPGHGWLEVPLEELRELDIVGKITPFSFLHGGMAYLEEDQDAETYLLARAASGLPMPYLQEVYEEHTSIRSYKQFVDDIQ